MAEKRKQKSSRFSDCGKVSKTLSPLVGFESKPVVSLREAVVPLIGIVPDVERNAFLTRKHCEHPKDGLPIEESAAIMLYTMESVNQRDSLYAIFNAALRSENRSALKPWWLYLRLIMNGLMRLSPVTTTIYRGVTGDIGDKYVKGHDFVWWGFSSCTLHIETLENESFFGKSGTRTLFQIESFSGKRIKNHSFIPSEDEVLLMPGTSFVVKSSLKAGNGLTIIQLQELEREDTLILSPEAVNYTNQRSKQEIPTTLVNIGQSAPDGKHIMLSYHESDEDLVNEIYLNLKYEEYDVWMDCYGIKENENSDVAAAIEKAWVVICFLSADYQNDQKRQKELTFANKCEKKMIPVLIRSNWKPTGWLGMLISDIPPIKWEGTEPGNVNEKMTDLLHRLEAMITGDYSKHRRAKPRN